MSLAKRIIPCLDVRAGRVVKGVRFRDHKDMGDILELAQRYRDQGADELVFYDISASPEGRTLDMDWVGRVARNLDIPFCVAGGIRSLDNARKILAAGADKISVNSPALEDPQLIDRLVAEFGSQCIVAGIDSIEVDGNWQVKQYTGDPDKTRDSRRATLDWVREVCDRGAGEIVLNCMSFDGVRRGYDIRQLQAVRAVAPCPLIASGGAGKVQHFTDVFNQADVDGALAASIFHSGELPVPVLKSALAEAAIEVRI